MAKTTFAQGTPVPVAWFNAVTNPTYSQSPQNDGELPAPTNNDLSQAPGQIVPEWTAFRDELKVTQTVGLTVGWTAGTVTLGTGEKQTIAAGNLNLGTTNGDRWIFVNTSGEVIATLDQPIRGLLLAKCTIASNNISGQIEDLRPRYSVTPRPNIISVFGSDGYEGDYTAPAGTSTLSGVRRYRNFTVPSNATVNITPGFLKILASGTVNIQGVINISPLVLGGKSFGGGLVAQVISATSGVGLGGAAGHNAPPPIAYSFEISPQSSGGASGLINLSATSANVNGSTGGDGGGTLIIEAAGQITVSGQILASGGNAVAGSVNVVPASGSLHLPGGGGGSGGLVWLLSAQQILVTAAATISVAGGNGANGVIYNATTPARGGGGGGGGWLAFASPIIQTTGSTLTITGGVAGANSSGTGVGFSGSSGGAFGGNGGGASVSGSIGQIRVNNYLPI